MYTDTNLIGERGENFATGLLMTDEIFFAKVLGGKVPSFDVYAEVNDDNTPFPLLIQIKTTTKADRYNKNIYQYDNVTILILLETPLQFNKINA